MTECIHGSQPTPFSYEEHVMFENKKYMSGINIHYSNYGKSTLRHAFVCILLFLVMIHPASAQTANPSQDVVGAQPAVPTGLQAPLPALAAQLPNPNKPLISSPRLSDLNGFKVTGPLTIDNAVALAIALNRSLALAGEALLRAQGRTSETKAAFNPTLAGTFQYTRLDSGQSASFGGQTFSLVNVDQPILGIQATLPLDISGLLRVATQQAQFQEVAARIEINRVRNQLVLDVKSAFYDVLRAQALVAVATETLQNSQDRLVDAQKKFDAGTVAKFDVIRAETDVYSARQQLIEARSNVSSTIAALNSAIGININTPLQVTSAGAVETPPLAPEQPADTHNQTSAPAVTFDSLNLGPDYDSVLRESLSTRPDILEADANIAAAAKGIVIARRSSLPSLGLSIGGNYAPNVAGFSPKTTSGSLVLSLAVPIFDGGISRARVEQARADVSTAQTNRRQAEDLVSLEVRQVYLNLLQSRDRISVANQALVQAREGFRLARVRYNAGVSSQAGISPLLEVSDAQAALTQAESNQVSALYDYNNARARLDKAVGRYAFVNNGPGFSAPPSARTLGKSDIGVRK